MAFNSLHFIVFLPVVFLTYFVLPARLRLGWLLVAGLYFYMVWNPVYILLLLGATVVAFGGGLALERERRPERRKAILGVSLGLLIGTLFVYKYFNFFMASLDRGLGLVGLDVAAPHVRLLLPLGISFYTFQKVAYLVDVYRGTIRAEARPATFTLFATFFPQLVAGPIERAKHLLPQLSAPAGFDYARVVSGLRLVTWGFFKKVVVADRLAPFVQQVYSDPRSYEGVPLSMATVAFAFQVYCDFSGYADIAVGTARIFGVSLTQNFRQPYFATSIADFWKRWHITLSTWLTDYVYTPLSRSRSIRLPWYPKLLACLLVTFIVSGLWHGAAWTFVVWGGLHGLYLVGSVSTQQVRRKAVRLIRLDRVPAVHTGLRIVFTFALVCFSYIFFRAEQVTDAFYITGNLFTGVPAFAADVVSGDWPRVADQLLAAGRIDQFTLAVMGIVTVVSVDAAQRWKLPSPAFDKWPSGLRWAAYTAALLVVIICGAFYDSSQTFIYFQF